MTNGCKMIWIFFGLGHGKEPLDREIVFFKRFVKHEQLNSHHTKLQNSTDVMGFLHVNLSNITETSYNGQRRPLQKIFWHVTTTDVDCNSTMYGCDVVESIMRLHSICSMNKNNLTTLLVKSLACLYLLWMVFGTSA